MHPFFSLFDLQLPAYWLMGLLGTLAAGGLLLWNPQRNGVARNDALYAAFHAAAGALVGSKLLFVLTLAPTLIAHRDQLTYEVWTNILLGGGVFYGGLLGGAAGATWYCRRYSIPLKNLIAAATPSIPLFHAFGRVGCFLAGCCWGVEWHGGIVFEQSIAAPNGVPLFPVQPVEAGFNLMLVAILLVYRSRAKTPWKTLPLYSILYGVGRFALEFLRGDSVRGVWLFSTSQWISIAMVAACTILMLHQRRKINGTI